MMIQKVKQAYRRYGTLGMLRRGAAIAYRQTARRLMPETEHVLYAGIAVAKNQRLGDRVMARVLGSSYRTADKLEYEVGVMNGLRQHVRSGDRVVVVGGGIGVTVASAAMLAGDSGNVICYEGGAEEVLLVRETLRRNGLSNRVDVHHAVVGPNIAVYGAADAAERLGPADLPDCDVLELDCEGAEIAILSDMAVTPRVVIVETHGLYGAPSAEVADLLQRRGYSVVDFGIAEPRVRKFCEENDVRVLVGSSLNR